ncbi:MAG: hypothetical protein IJE46_06815 [Clostridia bacterium]|nr:hypothetical protein [Clostridia bacterium]
MQVDEKLKLNGGIIKIIAGNSAKTLYGEYRTLKECLELGKVISDKPISNVVVMHEEANKGNVYQFGGHGCAFWEHIGTLKGFA